MSEAQLQSSTTASHSPYTQRGLIFSRRFSKEGISPYDDVQWERRTASITDTKGNTIFEQKDVEVPVDWSMTATNIVASTGTGGAGTCTVNLQWTGSSNADNYSLQYQLVSGGSGINAGAAGAALQTAVKRTSVRSIGYFSGRS